MRAGLFFALFKALFGLTKQLGHSLTLSAIADFGLFAGLPVTLDVPFQAGLLFGQIVDLYQQLLGHLPSGALMVCRLALKIRLLCPQRLQVAASDTDNAVELR